MFDFLRKYQKFFLALTAGAMIISFAFFGTYSTITNNEKIPNRIIGTRIDKSPVYQVEFEQLKRFINSDRHDVKQGFANILNDGVIRYDFMNDGIGSILAKNYFDQIKESFGEKIETKKKYRGYRHPYNSAITAENLWANFAPNLLMQLKQFQSKQGGADETSFEDLASLYLEEQNFPSAVLRQYLRIQEYQGGESRKDPNLQSQDLSLFRASSVEDWFGKSYLDLCAMFIENVASYASKNGYKVTDGEAKADLYRICLETIKNQNPNHELTEDQLQNAYQYTVNGLGMREKDITSVWKKVLLFRKYMKDSSNSVFLDTNFYQNFNAFSSEKADVTLYKINDNMKLDSLWDLFQLKYYQDAVYNKSPGLISSDASQKNLESIESSHPELIERRFYLECSQIDIKDAYEHIGLKQMWDWQKNPDNYAKLEDSFPILRFSGNQTIENVLANLQGSNRAEIDTLSKKLMVLENRELLEQAFANTSSEKKVYSFSEKGVNFPFRGIKKRKEFIALLTSALENPADAKELELFRANDKNFYRILVLEDFGKKEVMPFQDAKNAGVVNELLTKKLSSTYESIRIKDPLAYQSANGDFKPITQVRELVGKQVYSKLLKDMENTYVKTGEKLLGDSLDQPSFFYLSNCFRPYMTEVLSKVRSDEDFDVFKASIDEESVFARADLTSQWLLEKENVVVERSKAHQLIGKEVFSKKKNFLSSVEASDNQAFFYRLNKVYKDENLDVANLVEDARSTLTKDAKKEVMKTLLEEFAKEDGSMQIVMEQS